jgi:hypothetical protein
MKVVEDYIIKRGLLTPTCLRSSEKSRMEEDFKSGSLTPITKVVKMITNWKSMYGLHYNDSKIN